MSVNKAYAMNMQCCDLETKVSWLEFIFQRSRSWSRDQMPRSWSRVISLKVSNLVSSC